MSTEENSKAKNFSRKIAKQGENIFFFCEAKRIENFLSCKKLRKIAKLQFFFSKLRENRFASQFFAIVRIRNANFEPYTDRDLD